MIITVILLNTGVGVTQELRAERAIGALNDLAAPRARVLRGGTDRLIDAAAVVPGDLLLLEAGDIIAADAEVAEAHELQTDDSALTGESAAVPKAAGDEHFAGTTVTRGRGRATVTNTGAASSLGRIASLMAQARPGPTPLQRRLNRLGQQLTVAAISISALVMLLALARGLSWADAGLTRPVSPSQQCPSRCLPSSRSRSPSAPTGWLVTRQSPVSCELSKLSDR